MFCWLRIINIINIINASISLSVLTKINNTNILLIDEYESYRNSQKYREKQSTLKNTNAENQYNILNIDAENTINDTTTEQQTENKKKLVYIRINTNGPINFIRGYFYWKNDMILQKMKLSPELNIKYKLIIEKKTYEYEKPNYRKTELAVQNKNIKKEEIEYMNAYHKTLSILYECNNGINIANNRLYSFYTFLNLEHVKKEVPKLLAAFLLIGEGINVNLKVKKENNKKYLVLERNCGFKIPITIESGNEKWSYSSVVDLVKYFNNHFLKWDQFCPSRDSAEEFETGLFIYSPNFIVQSYIHEFVTEGYEELLKIIRNYYKLLKECENEENYEKVYKRSFCNIENTCPIDNISLNSIIESKSLFDGINQNNIIDNNPKTITTNECNNNSYNKNSVLFYIPNDNSDQYDIIKVTKKKPLEKSLYENMIMDLKYIDSENDKRDIFPFEDKTQLPKYKAVNKSRRIGDTVVPFLTNERNRIYSNCCEISIFNFLAFLLYDKKTKKLNIQNFEKTGIKSVVDFYKKYNDPRKIIYDKTFNQEWSNAIADLKCEEIRYLKKDKIEENGELIWIRNEISSGIINSFRVIAFICGLEDTKMAFSDLGCNQENSNECNTCNSNENINNNDNLNNKHKYINYDISKVEDLINKISKKIAVNKNFSLEIVYSRHIIKDGKNELSGKIILKYEDKTTFELKIDDSHQEANFWINTSNLDIGINKIIDKYNKTNYLIFRLHHNYLFNYLSKPVIKEYIYNIIKEKEENFKTYCLFNLLILRINLEKKIERLNDLHFFLILKFKKNIDEKTFKKDEYFYFLQSIKKTTPEITKIFIRLFSNIIASVNINEKSIFYAITLPLFLFDGKCKNFLYIKLIDINNIYEIYDFEDIHIIILELGGIIKTLPWILELFTFEIKKKLAIKNLTKISSELANVFLDFSFFSYTCEIASLGIKLITEGLNLYNKNSDAYSLNMFSNNLHFIKPNNNTNDADQLNLHNINNTLNVNDGNKNHVNINYNLDKFFINEFHTLNLTNLLKVSKKWDLVFVCYNYNYYIQNIDWITFYLTAFNHLSALKESISQFYLKFNLKSPFIHYGFETSYIFDNILKYKNNLLAKRLITPFHIFLVLLRYGFSSDNFVDILSFILDHGTSINPILVFSALEYNFYKFSDFKNSLNYIYRVYKKKSSYSNSDKALINISNYLNEFRNLIINITKFYINKIDFKKFSDKKIFLDKLKNLAYIKNQLYEFEIILLQTAQHTFY